MDTTSLRGRRALCDDLDRLLMAARSGSSSVLSLRGDAGIGKSALLEYLAEQASGCDVIRCSGVESELELPFAAAQQLFAPMMRRADELPTSQRDALRTAFGLAVGPPPDGVLVGVAILSLLATATDD